MGVLATSLSHPDWNLLYDQFWTFTVTGLTAGSIYALVALGYTLVYGVLRLINFAHSEIFMIGTFGAVFAVELAGHHQGDPAETGLALVGVLIVCAGRLDGLLRRRRRAPRARRLPAAAQAQRDPPRRPHLGHRRLAAPSRSSVANTVERTAATSSRFPGVILENHTVFTIFGTDIRNDQLIVIVVGPPHDGRPRPVRAPHPARSRHPGRRPGHRDGHADGRQHRPGHHAHVPARRHHGRRGAACST